MKGEGASLRGTLLSSSSWAIWSSLRFFPSSSPSFPHNFYYKYCFCSLQVPIWFLPHCPKLRTGSLSFMFGVSPLKQNGKFLSLFLKLCHILTSLSCLGYPGSLCSHSLLFCSFLKIIWSSQKIEWMPDWKGREAGYVLLMAVQAIKLFWFLMGKLKGKKGLLKPLGSHIGSPKLRPGVLSTDEWCKEELKLLERAVVLPGMWWWAWWVCGEQRYCDGSRGKDIILAGGCLSTGWLIWLWDTEGIYEFPSSFPLVKGVP